MKTLTQKFWNFSHVIFVGCILASPAATAEDTGGTSGGGGDYTQGRILDRAEFDHPVKDLRSEFKDAFAIVDRKIEMLRNLVPDFAADLEVAFQQSELTWYHASQSLDGNQGRKPNPLIKASDLARGLTQTATAVLIDPGFSSKSAEDQADGFLHEAVRNLEKKKPNGGASEDILREVGARIMNLKGDEDAKAFKTFVNKRLAASYLSTDGVKAAMQILKNYYDSFCATGGLNAGSVDGFKAEDVYAALLQSSKYHLDGIYEEKPDFQLAAMMAADLPPSNSHPHTVLLMDIACKAINRDGSIRLREKQDIEEEMTRDASRMNQTLKAAANTYLSPSRGKERAIASDRMECAKSFETARSTVTPSATPGMSGSQAR